MCVHVCVYVLIPWVDFLSLNIKYWITFYPLTFWEPKINGACSSYVSKFIFLEKP